MKLLLIYENLFTFSHFIDFLSTFSIFIFKILYFISIEHFNLYQDFNYQVKILNISEFVENFLLNKQTLSYFYIIKKRIKLHFYDFYNFLYSSQFTYFDEFNK